MATDGARQLYERVVELLGTRDVHPEDRIAIRAELGENTTWDDLSPEAQQLIEEAEQLPRQSWDDPADVPDEILDASG